MRRNSRNGPRLPRSLITAALLFLAGQASAQTVQKCIAASGHITLTSGACGAGERLAARYDAVPEAAPTHAPAAKPSVSAEPVRRKSSVSRPSSSPAPRSRRRADPCQSARDRRERTLERVGLKRDFNLLRRLDDEVWAACR